MRHGVEYYNDSKATNVDATIKAVESFPGGIHLILGGKDKDSDYAQLAPLLRERVKVVYTIGSAAEKIERQLAGVVKIVVRRVRLTRLSTARPRRPWPAISCCWRRPAPASTSLKTTSIAAASSASSCWQ